MRQYSSYFGQGQDAMPLQASRSTCHLSTGLLCLSGLVSVYGPSTRLESPSTCCILLLCT